MKRHENNLNPGPLTVSGFRGGSCCLVNLPDNNRTPLKPTAKGHRWFWPQSGFGFNALKPTILENIWRAKSEDLDGEFNGNPGIMKLCLEIISPEFPDYLVENHFRMRNSERVTHPVRTVLTNHSARLSYSSSMLRIAEICFGITFNPVCRKIGNSDSQKSDQLFFNYFRSRTSYRWRNTKRKNLLAESALGQKQAGEFGVNRATN